MRRKNSLFVAFAAAGLLLPAVLGCRGRDAGPPVPEAGPSVREADLSLFKPKAEFAGRIVFQSDLDGDNDIYVLTGTGLRRLTDDPASDEYPRWSPDGRTVAFTSNRGGTYQIYLMDEDGRNVRRVTDAPGDAIEQGWYPDGKKLAYTVQVKRAVGRSYRLWTLDLATGAAAPLLPDFSGSTALPDFSAAAPLLAFTGKRTRGWDAFLADLRTGEVRALSQGGKSCRPRFSPDGARIAYVSSTADGKGDVWLVNPDGGGKEQLTDRPDSFDYYPAWSPDGNWIVFASGTEHYPTEGVWELALVEPGTKRVVPLFKSGGRDVYPDWR